MAVILVLLFLLLRPEDVEEPVPTGTSTPSPEVTATLEDTGGTPEPTSTPSLDAVEIEVEEGRVEGPARITVAQGDRVAIEVKADVADEVHVHGYDVFADLSPDEEVLVEFRATIPGIFEIELEDAGLLLAQLEVTP